MAKSPTYRMKSRMIIVLVGMIVFGFCVVLHQLFKLQIVEGEELQSYALQQQLRTTRIGAKRGTIYDRNMKPLAQSATVWSVCIAPGQITDKDAETAKRNEDAVVDCLNKILEVDEDFVRKKLERKQSLYEVVKTKVEKDKADELMQFVDDNDIPGIFLEEDTRRYYPYGNFLSTVLGFTNSDNQGAYGLESYYEKVLAGTPGRVVSLKNSRGVDMPMQYAQEYEAVDGYSLVLTIDEKIQHYLEKNLETAVMEHKVGNRICGIVMDVKTGEILAMATKPDFDPNDPYTILDPVTLEKLEELNTVEQNEEYKKAKQEAQYAQWRNKAISDPYEPGSVFKIVTAAGAMESGAVDSTSSFYCPGYVEVAGRLIHCWYWSSHHEGHGMQDLEHAIMNSCNPAFVDIGKRLGATRFAEYFENFGLTEPTGIDLPGEATSIYHQGGYTESDLASSSFGQTFKVTPIQMITAVSAAVNGGKLMQPYIVKQIVDNDGNIISTTEPVVKRQVIAEDVSRELSLMLEQVVENGSGKQARVPGYRIGGKTGTSEKIEYLPDGTRNDKNILSFAGFAPVDDPQVVCLVMIDEPDIYNAYGSTIAAPIVGSVLADVLPYIGIEPQYTEEELENIATKAPYLLNMDIHEAEYEVRIRGLKYRVMGNGTKVLRQLPNVGEPVSKDSTIILYTEEEMTGEMVTVPDVVGMSGEAANQAIINAGLNISITGTGIEGSHSVAASQNPAAGEQVESGTVVTVEFVDSQLGG